MLIDSGNGVFFDQSIKALNNISKLEKISEFKLSNIKKILQTHCHVDHILGLYKFIKKIIPKPIIISSLQEAYFIEKGDKKVILPIGGELLGPMFSEISKAFTGTNIFPVNVDIKLNNNDHVKIGDFDFKVIHTPGHTIGSICLYEEDKRIIFTGDTVFTNGSFGRTDFPTGDSSQLVSSLELLSNLNVKILLPGHMDPVLSEGEKHIKSAFKIASSFL